ncbi:hypothetical protein FGADI_7974 [Fusarium gaditjirri]|uniref:Uncharacterized protein n=1 Tax=Fusarium gaditjirri TaxID=282569 RepID=A0A8H4WU09_9HYPO|nr:hypothetical protein FGADI_7974 [Fusarium gaditjirri]
MSSKPSSSKETMALRPLPPPEPPENLALPLQGGKIIFFTVNTLFDHDRATGCGLLKCKQLSQALRDKPIDELKRGYHKAMAVAYSQLLQAQVNVPPPGGSHQTSIDKVSMIFHQLGLDPPSESERRLIGREFAAEFSRNRYEVRDASWCLAQLKQLEYALVVVDDAVDWDVVKDLNVWHYIDALITYGEATVRKPDARVFRKALDICRVHPMQAIIVGASLEDDIVGILKVGAEPIWHSPRHHSVVVDLKGTRVLVVRSLRELVAEIHGRPNNQDLVEYQKQQQLAVPAPAVHPPMIYAPQNRGYMDERNGGPSGQYAHEGPSQPRHPGPKPSYMDDGHAYQPLTPLSESGSSDESRRSHRLPRISEHGRSSRDYKRDVRPVPPSSCVPSKRRRDGSVYQGPSLPTTPEIPPRHGQGYLSNSELGDFNGSARGSSHGASTQERRPPSPTPATELGRGRDHRSPEIYSTSHEPVHRRPPSPPRWLPPIRLYPPTEDYGISRPPDTRYYDQDARYQNQQRSWHSGRHCEISDRTYHSRDHYQARPASLYQSIHEPRSRTMSQQIGPSPGVSYGPERDGYARRAASVSDFNHHMPWEPRNAGPSGERTQERRDALHPPCPEERSVGPYRRQVIDLTSASRNAEPSNPARLFASAGVMQDHPYSPRSPVLWNRALAERQAQARPEAVERYEAGPSSQQPSSYTTEEAVACDRSQAVMPPSRFTSSEARPTLRDSGSQTDFPDHRAARSSGQHHIAAPDQGELRVFAQGALDLGRASPRVSSSSKDFNE